MKAATAASGVTLSLMLSGCPWPWPVMASLEFTVVDARTEAPIPNARVVYLACDVHDPGCERAYLARASSGANGTVTLPGRREWGFWVVGVPGAVPVPNHFVAVWAPGYAAFTYNQYGGGASPPRISNTRRDILDALGEIPHDQSSSDPSLNPSEALEGGKIRLRVDSGPGRSTRN